MGGTFPCGIMNAVGARGPEFPGQGVALNNRHWDGVERLILPHTRSSGDLKPGSLCTHPHPRPPPPTPCQFAGSEPDQLDMGRM